MKKIRQKASFFLIFFCFILNTQAQEKLQIENGDLVILRENENSQSQWLYKNEEGQARLRQKNTTIDADSTKYFETRNYAEALGNVYINQADSIDIYSKTARYFGNERRSVLQGEVALLQDVYTLQTDKLNYNFNTRVATYNTGGELSDTTSTLRSVKGKYNLQTKQAVFTDSVVLISPDRRIETDTLNYDTETRWADFRGPTVIYEEDQVIRTTKGRYNTETGAAVIEGDPQIESETSSFTADNVELDKEGGIGKATGNVYYLDKENQLELRSDYAEQLDSNRIEATGNVDIYSIEDSIRLLTKRAIVNNEEKEFFGREDVILTLENDQTELLADSLDVFENEGYALAQGRPFLTTVQEEDSIFVIADTLEAIRQDQTPDSTYNMIANKNVKLFKQDLQAIADSAYVNNIDSTITLLKQPVIWSDSTQMSADTIRIFLKNQKIDKVEFRQNCFFINLENDGLYNQMKGKMMDAYFKNDELDSLFVNGNAETIYYATDDAGAYVGVDKMRSGQIEVQFEGGQMKEVLWLKQQEGTTFPFQNIDPQNYLFSGFRWRASQRPASKNYLLIASGRKEGKLPEEEIITAPNDSQQQNTLQLGGKKKKNKQTTDD